MKFTKDEIMIPTEAVYAAGVLAVDGYEDDGTLLAHPIGGGLQYRLKPIAEQQFRRVSGEEKNSPLWRRSKFDIEGVEAEFAGWTDGRRWNGWAMPCFEFEEAQRVIQAMTNSKPVFDQCRDCFVTISGGGDEESWEGLLIKLVSGQQIKVYGVGAGSWIWDELENAGIS